MNTLKHFLDWKPLNLISVNLIIEIKFLSEKSFLQEGETQKKSNPIF